MHDLSRVRMVRHDPMHWPALSRVLTAGGTSRWGIASQDFAWKSGLALAAGKKSTLQAFFRTAKSLQSAPAAERVRQSHSFITKSNHRGLDPYRPE